VGLNRRLTERNKFSTLGTVSIQCLIIDSSACSLISMISVPTQLIPSPS